MNRAYCGRMKAAGAAILWMVATLGGRASAQCTGYNVAVLTGQGPVPGITDTGIHGDDVTAIIPLPFPMVVYGQTFTVAIAASNGQMTMGPSGTGAFSNVCLPAAGTFPNVALLPFWDDLRTDGPGQGIFTATYGSAPNRYFVVEWRAGYYSGYTGTADFGVILREGLPYFDFEYLNVNDGTGVGQSEGASSTIGVQASGSGPVTQFGCNAGGLVNGEYIRFTCAPYQAPACSLSLSDPGDYAGTAFNVYCTVTPGSGPVSTGLGVSLDASAVGGGTVTLHDDGIPPDATAQDHIFSGTVTSGAGVSPGSYTLTSTVSDAQERSSTCAATYWIIAPPGACSGYNIAVSQVSQLLPTSTDIGNHGDDVLTTIALPFPVSVYGQTFTQATVCSNGQMTMGPSGTSAYVNVCLPSGAFPNVALAPFWDDLRTDGAGHGIFTATYQSAPYRVFVIEWRAGYYSGYTGTVDFEIVLHENEPYFDYLYGTVNDGPGSGQSEGASSTIGVQQAGAASASQFGCNSGGLFNGEWLRFSCTTATPLACSTALSAPGGFPGDSFTAYCTVTPGNGPVSTNLAVSMDASSIGGGTVTLHDDGVPPDVTAGDSIFSGTITSSASASPNTYTLSAAVTDAEGQLSNCGTVYTLLARPGNDDCAGALPAVLGDNPFDSTNASTSSPDAPCAGLGNDLWYTYTPPANGQLTVATCGATLFDTAIAIYSDCNTPLECNDDFCGYESSISLCVTAGTQYLLRIGGYNGARWAGTFNVAFTPGNLGLVARDVPQCGAPGTLVILGVYAPTGSCSGLSVAGVTADCSQINGGGIALRDDGIPPDPTAGDGLFSGTVLVGAGAPHGSRTITFTCTLSDGSTRTATAGYYVAAPDDAGDLPATAADGGSPTINGVIGSECGDNDADMFLIHICDPDRFSAYAAGFDTQLFLFRADGTGVAMNDDVAFDNRSSFFPVGSIPNLAAGDYYIAISPYPMEPFDAYGRYLWGGLLPPPGAVAAPDGPGAGHPIGGWNDAFSPGGTYTITLTGTSATSCTCCRIDYNGDGDIGTDADIEAFFACLGGDCCATCPPDSDFNCDGDIGTDADIESFFRVLAGGPC